MNISLTDTPGTSFKWSKKSSCLSRCLLGEIEWLGEARGTCLKLRLPSWLRIGYGALHFGPWEYHIKVTGFEPMALCTQNRCADQTALHLVSPPSGAYRSTRSMNTWTELAHPFGHRDARTNPSNQPLFFKTQPPALYGFLLSSFTWISKLAPGYLTYGDPSPA